MQIKNILKQIGLMLIVVLVATTIDYVVHSLSESFYVSFDYFTNKVFFATIWGIVGVFVFRNYIKNPTKLAIATSAFIAVVLQTKYFLQGYPLFFVFLFMFLHFLMFLVPSIPIFRKYSSLFIK